ncbi:Mur ligase family protein [uncultured Sphaerochaeta sp.]|uniref:Mur ligase family protein n=1 Tax=uncultured Sphaerochaeta sp. TaxID=886478 RepID=UPI002A0A314D|nr:Mur ligase family protein [uncultured Sphaerochaeta sp.]
MKVLIFGLGMHGGGFAAASYFLDHGDEVRITDLKGTSDLGYEMEDLNQRGALCISGPHRAEDFLWADIVVKNPAIPPNHSMLRYARMVVNDFAWLFSSPWCEQVKIIGITGTKGKTTTSAAVAHVLQEYGYEAMQCGNMGISGFSILREWERRNEQGRALPEFLVCEFSSWQIRDTVQAMHGQLPMMELCALTNFYPDHLNSYESIERYLEDKLQLFTRNIKMAVIPDVMLDRIRTQTHLDKRHIRGIDRASAKVLEEQPHLRSAYAILLALGFKYKSILKALQSFQGVPHRIEQLGMFGNILFVNDSAATIPEAVHFSYAKFRTMAVHLICGGTDKNLKAEGMLEELQHASSISLLDGSFTRGKLIPLLEKYHIPYFGPFKSMGDALQQSYEMARVKELELPNLVQAILLSPGSASFELFANEFDRGNQFKNLVGLLLGS